MSKTFKLFIAITLAVASSLNVLPASAAPLASQNPGLRFDGDPSIGGTVYVNLTDTPENSTATFKWTSGKKTVATTNTFVIPNTMTTGQPLQVSVTNSAPGYAKWSYLSPIIKVGQITLVKAGVKTGNFLVGSATSYSDDQLFPPKFNLQGMAQVRNATDWKVDGVTTSTIGTRLITPSSDQIGKVVSLTNTYNFGTLPSLTVSHEVGKVVGFIGTGTDGTLSNNYTVGETVTVTSLPTWSVTPDAVTYQWTRDGKVIPGQKNSSYKFVPADWHKYIKVQITATKANYVPRVIELGKNGVLKEVTVSTTVTDGERAWQGCEGFDVQNILCMKAGANPKWMGAINLVRTQDDILYAAFAVHRPEPSGLLLRWQAKVVGISSVDLYPYEATGIGSEFVIDNPNSKKFALSVNQKKDSTWTTDWFTSGPDAGLNLNFGLVAEESGSFVIKSVQLTAVYRQ